MNTSSVDVLANTVGPAEAANSVATPLMKRPTWEQAEGNPLPLGVKWIEEEQAFNFAVHSEHAESVTLLLYAATDLVNPVLTFRFDFLHNKSGRIWHCRIAIWSRRLNMDFTKSHRTRRQEPQGTAARLRVRDHRQARFGKGV